ncbi:MAG: hypothetical protein PHN38_04860 [Sulfurospirillaceae bacterium]|nr:hypothetical protein [Sulfurospirillaceae bacterium]MDD3462520.1 hypothetical protein [Sulfurospirillaceae bacterium]
MSGGRFIRKMQGLFGISPAGDKSKEKAIKELIEKLKERKKLLRKELETTTDIRQRESLKDSIKIIKKQIDKGKDIL